MKKWQSILLAFLLALLVVPSLATAAFAQTGHPPVVKHSAAHHGKHRRHHHRPRHHA